MSSNDSDVKTVVAKYSIVLGFAIAIVLILFSSRERIEAFDPESFKEEISEVALLFLNEEILGGSSKAQKFDQISYEYEEVELGVYFFDAEFAFTVNGKEHILLTGWKYSSINDNLDLLSFSLDDSEIEFLKSH
jgi:hypothetical protein